MKTRKRKESERKRQWKSANAELKTHRELDAQVGALGEQLRPLLRQIQAVQEQARVVDDQPVSGCPPDLMRWLLLAAEPGVVVRLPTGPDGVDFRSRSALSRSIPNALVRRLRLLVGFKQKWISSPHWRPFLAVA